VRDNTGGVLPGVTVTATHEAAGTTFVGVTDEAGLYRIVLRAGVYRITAELPGFASVARPRIELLVGRTATLNLEMGVSGVQETVTVTGEAPLIDSPSRSAASRTSRGSAATQLPNSSSPPTGSTPPRAGPRA
jgi:hypothetical protein